MQVCVQGAHLCYCIFVFAEQFFCSKSASPSNRRNQVDVNILWPCVQHFEQYCQHRCKIPNTSFLNSGLQAGELGKITFCTRSKPSFRKNVAEAQRPPESQRVLFSMHGVHFVCREALHRPTAKRI